ncbi:MAG: ribose 5-phosphate isomerase B [Promethearchaeota archaeon]|jgi:ribose 5-phosphate isomerase B
MKVIIGSDHGGFKLKETIKEYIKELGYNIEDLGTNSTESVDYPVYAKKVAEEVKKDKDKLGILMCGTGLGMCMTANKFKGIRAALCYNESSAKLAKQHNNANILCLGGREFKEELAKKITKIFLETPFSNEERHKRRIKEIEK